ncbi:amidohydrolase family protein [Micrococcaceae bacterium Sec5.7]
MQAFIDRIMESGNILAPDERITVQDAMYAYTTWSAPATGAGHVKGSISTGKLADFVAVDRNPLYLGRDTLDNIYVVASAVDGKFSYEQI